MAASDQLDFVKYVKKVFMDELERSDKFLSETDLKTLLDETQSDKKGPRDSIVGYPTYPLYREIGKMLNKWQEERRCPALDLPRFELLDDNSYIDVREGTIATVTPLLTGLESLWRDWCEEEIVHRVRAILMHLGLRGILDLFGIRKTVGTKEMLPPARKALFASFFEKNNPKSELTVGARALTKHFHRDHTDSWWGLATGTEAQKNSHAEGLMHKILDNAVWINIHWLPHDVFIIEARQDQGYGLRWSADGSKFRGFLEPQMVDGHEVGWRH